jgi:hypothetical protein
LQPTRGIGQGVDRLWLTDRCTIALHLDATLGEGRCVGVGVPQADHLPQSEGVKEQIPLVGE